MNTKHSKDQLDSQVEDVEPNHSNVAVAAQFAAFEKDLSFWKTVKIYWRVCLWSLYGMILVFNFGIDGIIAGLTVAIPKFREDYGKPVEISPGYVDYVIPATWLAVFAAVSQAASVIGAFCAGYVADKIGRRLTFALSCVIALGGVAAQYFSNGSLGILVAGKAIKGIPVGMWIVIGPTYVSEIAPLRVRGVLASMTNSILFAGVFLFTGIGYVVAPRPGKGSYLIMFACQWALPAFVLITIFSLPESPVWLCRVGKRDKAARSLRRLHGNDKKTRQEGILAQIEETISKERQQRSLHDESNSYLECFNKVNRRRTLTTMFVYTCQYLSGNTLVFGYQTYFYQLSLGWSTDKSFAVGLGVTAFCFACNILAWVCIANLRRRLFLVWGQFGAAICLFVIGGCSVANTHSAWIAVVVFIYFWGLFYEVSLATVGWCIGAELPALRMRSRTQALANMCLQAMSWLQAFIFPYMFNPDAGNLGGKVAFYFGATTLVGFIGCFFFLPETLNRSPAEMDTLFEMKTPIKQFHSAVVDKPFEEGA